MEKDGKEGDSDQRENRYNDEQEETRKEKLHGVKP
jgi:hypothetical protein